MYFPTIDVLRGFAALSVLVYHVIEHFGWTGFPISGPLVWFRIGWLGVDLFFVISGFVICLSAFGLIDKHGPDSYRAAYIHRRLARIVPLYYLTLLVFIAFILPDFAFRPDAWIDLGSHLLFLHDLNPDFAGSIDGANWSISVEMQFYLLILLLAPVLRRCRWWWIPAIAFPIAWGWRIAMYIAIPVDSPMGPYRLFWATTQLPGSLDEFACGMLIARLVRGEAGRRLLGLARMHPWPLPLATAALVWVSLALYWRHATFWDAPLMIVLWRSLAAATCALVVLTACSLNRTGIRVSTAPLRFFGTISYGLYLWHLPVILSLRRLDWISGPRALPVVLGLTTLLASGSWFFFERAFTDRAPSRRLKAAP